MLIAVRISFEKCFGDSGSSAPLPRSHRHESNASRGARRIRPKLALLFQIRQLTYPSSPESPVALDLPPSRSPLRWAKEGRSLLGKIVCHRHVLPPSPFGLWRTSRRVPQRCPAASCVAKAMQDKCRDVLHFQKKLPQPVQSMKGIGKNGTPNRRVRAAPEHVHIHVLSRFDSAVRQPVQGNAQADLPRIASGLGNDLHPAVPLAAFLAMRQFHVFPFGDDVTRRCNG